MNDVQCIGIIPDGNRRWAEREGVPAVRGYEVGLEKVREVIGWVKRHRIPNVVLYGLSVENLQRGPETLDPVFSVLLSSNLPDKQLGVSFRVVGDLTQLPERVAETLRETEKRTAREREAVLWVLVGYGGRQDVVDGVNALIAAGEPVTGEVIQKMSAKP